MPAPGRLRSGRGFVRTHRAGPGDPVHRAYGEGLFVIRPDGRIGLAAHGPERVTSWLARFAG